MKDEILFSISCLTYNHVKYIRQCLDGFLMQQCDFKFEVLIHDDASTDGTIDIIREYQERYPEIIKPIIQTENQYSKGVRGMNQKYNYTRAKGKYIALCEGDDYWIDPLKLQKQVDILESNQEIGICVTRVNGVLDQSGKKIELREFVNSNKKNIYSIKDYLKYRFSQTSSFVFRKELYDENILKGYHAGDQALVLNIALKSKIYYLNDITSVYRINEHSITNISNPEYIRVSLEKLYDEVNKLTGYKYRSIINLHLLFLKLRTQNKLLYKLKNISYVLILKFLY